MQLQESGQMYLETIYVLSKTVSGVHSVDISEHMGYSKPSVSREDNHITLTEMGLAVAEKIYNRHIVLSKMLVALGVPEDIAAEDACRMEHTISDESFEAIRRHVERV